MAVLTGIAGAVEKATTDIDAVAEWSINHTADLQSFVASNTKQGTVVLDGNTDWTGSYRAYGHTPSIMPGDEFVFHGSIDGTNGATGSAIGDSVTITCDIEAAAPLVHTVAFSAHSSALTLGASAAADATTPAGLSSIGCDVQTGTAVGTPVYTAITDVRSWELTIQRANVSYVSSDTAAQVYRLAGNISGTISVSVYEDDWADLPAVNAHSYIRLYVSATEYWDIGFVKWGEATDLTVDREGAGMIGATLNGQWTGYELVDAAFAEGYIKTPAVVTWWPV